MKRVSGAPTDDPSAIRVAISGGSGFIGTNLVEHYTEAGVPVVNLDPLAPRDRGQAAHWRQVDPLNADQVSASLAEFAPTHVVHLGARTDLHGATVDDYAYNTRGVEIMIDACNAVSGLRRVVFASSRLVCRIGYQPASDTDYCPPNAYGASKVRGEQIVRGADVAFPWVIFRPTSIWGPWFDVPYRTFFSVIAANRYVHVGHGPVRKSFGYVGNTVQQLAAAAEAPGTELDGRTLYLADFPPIEVRDMAERIQRELGSRPIRTVPRTVLSPVARTGDVLQRLGWAEPPLTSFRLDNLLTEMVYDTAALQRIVAVPRYSLDEGIHATVAWMGEQGLLEPRRGEPRMSSVREGPAVGASAADGRQDSHERVRKLRKLWRLSRTPAFRRALLQRVAAAVEHETIPFQHDFLSIIDVGAHHGQFALFARERFPRAQLLCFEPLSQAQEILRRVFPERAPVELFGVALGSVTGTGHTMHVSKLDDSSSLLPITDRYTEAFPGTEEAATTTVPVQRLDDALDGLALARPCMLKIDVQGYELEVLRGGEHVLDNVDVVLLECSFVELYTGQALAAEIIAYLCSRGFTLTGVFGIKRDIAGRCLQADALFERSPSVPSP